MYSLNKGIEAWRTMAKLPYGIERIEALKHDAKLPKFIDFLQVDGVRPAKEMAGSIMIEFNIKSWLKPVLIHFLETGFIDSSLAEAPVRLHRDNVYADLQLVLAPDITQPILKEFITKNWSSKIKPRVSPFPYERHTVASFPDRDQKIYETYLNRKKLGLTIVGVALMYHVSESTVKRIVRVKKEA